MTTIEIAIADGTDSCRYALEGCIRENPLNYSLVYIGSNVNELLLNVQLFHPHLVIIQADMPEMRGEEICKQLLVLCPGTLVIGRCSTDIVYHARRMLRAGARGMLPRDASNAEIRQCLNLVTAGNYYLGKECSFLLSRKFKEEEELNEFEQEVLLRICKKQSTAQIAAETFIGEPTVRRAREKINRLAGNENPNPYAVMEWACKAGYICLKECWGL